MAVRFQSWERGEVAGAVTVVVGQEPSPGSWVTHSLLLSARG